MSWQARNIASNLTDKIVENQTERVVLNLKDWTGDLQALRTQFETYPVPGLVELLVILPDGTVVRLVP